MLTPEEFSLIYQQGEEATYAFFRELFDKVTRVEERVHTLEVQKNKNSTNSSKPPSTDAFRKPLPNLRKKTGRKSGGQTGSPGKTLQMRTECDVTLVHSPEDCSHCGASLQNTPACQTDQAQVHDLPPQKLVVTAHLRQHKCCPRCKHQTVAAFPEGVRAGAQYGPRFKALAVYLQYGQLLPFDRTAQLFAEVFDAPVSEGSLLTFLQEAAQTLVPVEQEITTQLLTQPVLHFDETGMRVGTKLQWVHVTATDRLTFYAPHARRGREALDAIGILPQFGGTALHDCFGTYFGYDVRHGLCNVHLCRELKGLWEACPQPWIRRLLRFLFGLKQRRERVLAAGGTGFSPEALAGFERVYLRLLALGAAQNPARPASGKRGKTKQSVGYNLLKRLSDHRSSVLRFAWDFGVPFSNNQAERDIRMVKLRQKVSGCFRSAEGAAMFCRVRGFVSTLRKQGQPLLSALGRVFSTPNDLISLLAE